jgi:valyl-tRNA synthetase
MNLITPPTDNLYKFIAITGLILILLSIILPFVKEEELSIKMQQDKTSGEVLKAKGKYLHEQNERLQKSNEMLIESINKHIKQIDDLLKLKKISSSEVLLQEVKDGTNELQNSLKKYDESINGIQSQLESVIEQKGNTELLLYLAKQLSTVKLISKIGIVLGLLLTIVGFWLWYTRLQVFQDKSIRKELQ